MSTEHAGPWRTPWPLALAILLVACARAPAEVDGADARGPLTPPDADRGAQIWDEQCSACHGALGDGVGARGDPSPPSLVSEGARGLAPVDVLTAVTSGVGTGDEHVFDVLPLADRWSVAFFVLALRHRDTDLEVSSGWALPTHSPFALAELDDLELAGRLRSAGLADEQIEPALARLRSVDAFGDRAPMARTRVLVGAAMEAQRSGQRPEARHRLVLAELDGLGPQAVLLRLSSPGLEAEVAWKLRSLGRGVAQAIPAIELERRAAALGIALERADRELGQPSSGLLRAARAAAIVLGESVPSLLLLLLIAIAALRPGADGRERKAMGLGLAFATGAALVVAMSAPAAIPGPMRATLRAVVSLGAAIAILVAADGTTRHLVRRTVPRRAAPALLALIFLGSFGAIAVVVVDAAPALSILGDPTAAATAGGVGLALLTGVLGLTVARRRVSRNVALASYGALAAVLVATAVGKGIGALQSLGTIPATPRGTLYSPWLGLFPTAETIAAQAVALAILAAVLAYGGTHALAGPPKVRATRRSGGRS